MWLSFLKETKLYRRAFFSSRSSFWVLILFVAFTSVAGKGDWSDWSAWSVCDVTCGKGKMNRSRQCVGEDKVSVSLDCSGDTTDEKPCNLTACTVDGGWGPWWSWTPCFGYCGTGTRSRIRQCNNPQPFGGGADCTGDQENTENCTRQPCPVINGWWSEWSDWSFCSSNCSEGTSSRERTCITPPPEFGGLNCIGNAQENMTCYIQRCPEDGAWTQWSEWTSCSSICGYGNSTRDRYCTDPPPSPSGKNCSGVFHQRRLCNLTACPVWTEWSAWGNCSVNCNASRVRTCYTDLDLGSVGANCTGMDMEGRRCNDFPGCPVDGEWSAWTEWTLCSASCGDGWRTKRRRCDSPAPKFGGTSCYGAFVDSIFCISQLCPETEHIHLTFPTASSCVDLKVLQVMLWEMVSTLDVSLPRGSGISLENVGSNPCSQKVTSQDLYVRIVDDSGRNDPDAVKRLMAQLKNSEMLLKSFLKNYLYVDNLRIEVSGSAVTSFPLWAWIIVGILAPILIMMFCFHVFFNHKVAAKVSPVPWESEQSLPTGHLECLVDEQPRQSFHLRRWHDTRVFNYQSSAVAPVRI